MEAAVALFNVIRDNWILMPNNNCFYNIHNILSNLSWGKTINLKDF